MPLTKAISIDGLDQIEFNYQYDGDQKEVLFAHSFPVLSFCFLNGCSVGMSKVGVNLSNKGGLVKKAADSPAADATALNDLLNREEVACAESWLERYQKHKQSIYGDSALAAMESSDKASNAEGGPLPPLFAFGDSFAKIANALLAGDGTITAANGVCTLSRPGQENVIVDTSAGKQTLNGFLAALEEKL